MVFVILVFIGLFILFSSYTKVNMNYAAKIQLNLNLAFFTPLFIVSIVILGLISQSLKNEVDDDHEQIAEVIGDNIITSIDQYLRGQLSNEQFSSEVSQVAKVAGIDISIFNKVGRLMVSSQPLIYQYGILSNYINPRAMVDIIENGKNSIIVEERIGNLVYDNTYVVVKSFETGNIMAVLSVPFFGSGGLLEQEQISVFTTIINIFSVVFIVFLGISYFVSKWLILPLNFITQKIKRTTLTDNEAIEWNSDDEIGLLVNEYNRMLVNLEANKRALARSEKESAWREMAKQVAHEIKNPLTPMKLTLQQLQRTTKNDENSSFERPIKNLLHQIDTLSDIATSFSSFAKMPIPENERFDLASCVRKTLGIYKNSKEAELIYNQEVKYVEVLGDEQLTGRILSNIIINSLQSSSEDRKLVIEVLLTLSEDGSKVHIAIKDNGTGIPEEAQSKVFVPNFSTKETGSGIGLAIAKHGIEHAGGTIWFESSEEGTTFHIELPVVK
jgi:signal transduction histidine kinase